MAPWLLALALPWSAATAIDRADPLPYPAGPAPGPDATLSVEERLDAGAEAFRSRGYGELPLLASAALELGGEGAVERAIELAPSVPSIRFEAGRRSRNPLEFARSVVALFGSFPGLLWLGTWASAALAAGLLTAAAVLVALGFARALGLHGHWIAHLGFDRDPPAWPGALLLGGAVALLPLLGVGPVTLAAVAGVLASVRLSRIQGIWLGEGLILAALLLGPPLDYWTRGTTAPASDPGGFAAWRVERRQPLPQDRARLEMERAARPDDAALHLASALAWKRAGDLDRAERALEAMPDPEAPGLAARHHNLRGILLLARGHVVEATRAFETAAAFANSAPVIYNLSQAHGRALRLIDQGDAFAAARALDSELVSRHTRLGDANLHFHLIETPLPIGVYLGRALEPSREARLLASRIRGAALGSSLPEETWIAIAILGALCMFLRRGAIGRCNRCLRALCARCSTTALTQAPICRRCAALFSHSATIDARVRRREIDKDRRRLRAGAQALAGLALFLPGSALVLEGRFAPGAIRLLLASTGLAALATVAAVPVPDEVGGLAVAIPLTVGAVLLLPTYASAAAESIGRLRTAGRTK